MYIIFSLIIICVIFFLKLILKKDIVLENEEKNIVIIRFNKTVIYVSLITVLFAFIVTILTTINGNIYMGLFFMLFFILGEYLLIEYFNRKIYINEVGLVEQNFFKNKKSIKWNEIIKIAYNNNMGWFIIEDIHKKNIKITSMSNELSEFTDIALKQCKKNVLTSECNEYFEILKTKTTYIK